MSRYLDSESVQSSFFIAKGNFDKAFKTLMHALDEKPDLCRMDQSYRNSKNLEELIRQCSWGVDFDDEGNICSIEHRGTNVSEEDLLFKSLSPFVESGSFVEYTREGYSNTQKHRYEFYDRKITIKEWWETLDMSGTFFWDEVGDETFDLTNE